MFLRLLQKCQTGQAPGAPPGDGPDGVGRPRPDRVDGPEQDAQPGPRVPAQRLVECGRVGQEEAC